MRQVILQEFLTLDGRARTPRRPMKLAEAKASESGAAALRYLAR
jgi:hypothetical protein